MILKAILKVNDNISIISGNVVLTEINKTVKIAKMQEVIIELSKEYDYVFIDVNPTPARVHVLTIGAVDQIIIPMLPHV